MSGGYLEHKVDGTNKDLYGKDRDYYLDLVRDWDDPLPLPALEQYGHNYVYDDGKCALFGTKMRAGDALMRVLARNGTKTVTYVQTIGKASPAIAVLSRKYGIDFTMFCPANKVITGDQIIAMENGAQAAWIRIAAMNNLRREAKAWAEENGGVMLPLGLAHELTTAAIVKTAVRLAQRDGEPKEVWTVMGSGVLSRALQIGWPNAEFHGVPVSRNLQPGEAGSAILHTYDTPFEKGLLKQDRPYKSSFSSIDNYDGKAYALMTRLRTKGAVFWNVASDTQPTLTQAALEQRGVLPTPEWKTVSWFKLYQ